MEHIPANPEEKPVTQEDIIELGNILAEIVQADAGHFEAHDSLGHQSSGIDLNFVDAEWVKIWRAFQKVTMADMGKFQELITPFREWAKANRSSTDTDVQRRAESMGFFVGYVGNKAFQKAVENSKKG